MSARQGTQVILVIERVETGRRQQTFWTNCYRPHSEVILALWDEDWNSETGTDSRSTHQVGSYMLCKATWGEQRSSMCRIASSFHHHQPQHVCAGKLRKEAAETYKSQHTEMQGNKGGSLQGDNNFSTRPHNRTFLSIRVVNTIH